MRHELDDESLIDDELFDILDQPIKVKRIQLSKTRPHATELYSDYELRFHRAQALIDTLASLKKGLADIVQWETQLLNGQDVTVRMVDVMPLMGMKYPASVRKAMAGFNSIKPKWKVWMWREVRSLVINRFTQVVMHSYLAALE